MNPRPVPKPQRRLVQIRLDTAIADSLRGLAAEDGRTMNGYLVKVCTDLVKGAQTQGQPQSTLVAPRGAVRLNA